MATTPNPPAVVPDAVPVPPPDPVAEARYLVSEKMLALSDAIDALGDDPVPGEISDELRLCTAWAYALNADDPPNVPSADQEAPLLAAIQQVEGLITASAAANAIIQAATTLVNTMKAPG